MVLVFRVQTSAFFLALGIPHMSTEGLPGSAWVRRWLLQWGYHLG